MGAFFLYKKNTAKVDVEAARKVFSDKGFDSPYISNFGEYQLLLYRKQLVDVANHIKIGEYELGVIGTITYKSLGYEDTIKTLLVDYMSGSINYNDIRGNFCALFINKDDIRFLTDDLNVQHLFTDSKENFITSSFLAAASAKKGALTINRKTAIEKLILGYTIGNETIFKEIVHLANSYKKDSSWNFLTPLKKSIPASDGKNKKVNAQKRSEKICEYLREFTKLADEYPPEIGLSDGFDSRTLYAATMKAWNKPIAVHTHCTENVHSHDEERRTVEKITKAIGSNLTVVPTRLLNGYTENEINTILRDGLFFFDGRCARDMGAFSPVYTRSYKKQVTKENRLTLNGLGGEVYRRYYLELKPLFDAKNWMKVHVYPEDIDRIISKPLFKSIHSDLVCKIEKELGIKWSGRVSNFDARRYYSEIVMPDCDALNCNAHNQISFYLTPFIEWDMIQDAYKSRDALGVCGELEAAIMNYLNPTIAGFPSHYGFAFTDRPKFTYKIKRIIRGLIPNSIETKRIALFARKNIGQLDYFNSVISKSDYLRKATEYEEQLFPEIDFQVLRHDYTMMPNSTYMSLVFYEFRDRIVEN